MTERERERRGTSVLRGKERKMSLPMSDDNDYTVVILDCSLDLPGGGYGDRVGISAQVNMKALQ